MAKLGLDENGNGGALGASSEPDVPGSDAGLIREDSSPWPSKEQERLALQQDLGSQKTQKSRNQLGQFATPPLLAEQVTRIASQALQSDAPVDFLEPAFGTGAFFSALLRTQDVGQIHACQGYEVDPHYAEPAQALWENEALSLTIEDFTKQEPPSTELERFNLIITNPFMSATIICTPSTSGISSG